MPHANPITRLTVSLLLLVLLQGCASLSPSTRLQPAPNGHTPADSAEPVLLETRDQVSLFGQWWLPAEPQDPRAVIVLLHGTIAHSGFYAPMAKHFAARGYAVLGIDLRGWEQSQGYARNGVVNNYDEYLLDLEAAWREAQSRYPGEPRFIQGESMGGAIALLSQIETEIRTEGLVLNAPAIRPGLSLGFLKLPHWLNDAGLWTLAQPGKVFPNMPALYHGRLMEKIGIGLLLREEENQQRFINDPYATHKALPLSYFTALQDATSRIEQGLDEVKAPLLVIHGTDDVLVPLKSSRFAMEELGSEDKTLKVYEDITHATLHDRRKEEIWNHILAWLDERLPAHAAQAPPGSSDVADLDTVPQAP